MNSKIGLDIAKFMMSFLVIAIHCWIVNVSKFIYSLCNLAVPCFFVISGYLLILKHKRDPENGIVHYLKHLITLYILWTVLYFPFSLYHILHSERELSAVRSYIHGIFVTGINFYAWQLWYLLALIYSTLIFYIMHKLKFLDSRGETISIFLSIFIVISGLLFGYIENNSTQFKFVYPAIKKFAVIYEVIPYRFYTAFVYMTIGMALVKYSEKLKKHIHLMIFLAIICLFLYQIEGRIFIYPLSFLIVFLLLTIKTSTNINESFLDQLGPYLRKMSGLIYFSHMLVLGIIQIWFNNVISGFYWQFFVSSVLTLLLSHFILILSQQSQTKFLSYLQ